MKVTNALIKRYSKLVYKLANRYKRDDQEVEDAIQDGMIGLYIALQKYDSNKGNISTYAWNWIRTKIQRGQRYLKHQVPTVSDDVCIYGTDIKLIDSLIAPNKIDYDRFYNTRLLRKYIKQLSSSSQDIIKLYLQGYTIKELYQMYGVSENTMHNRIYDIKKQLRNYYKRSKLYGKF